MSIVAMAFEQLLIAGAALIAFHYITSRVLKRHYQQVKARLSEQDSRRRRVERIAVSQASILELIASGTTLAGIQGPIGTMVKEETDGSWWLGPTGLAGLDPESDPMSEDLLVVVERLMAVATERDRISAALTREATHDALTGLANRAAVLERIRHAMRKRGGGSDLAVLFMDLDRFKQVNDSLGHEVGDQLLIEVARRLTASVREGDTVGRIGGDEFVVFLEEVSHEQAQAIAARMIETLLTPLTIGGAPIDIGVSIGVAMPEPGDHDPDKLLREADQAMDRAKESGVSLVCFAASA